MLVGNDSDIGTSSDMDDEDEIGPNSDEEDYNEEKRDGCGYIDPNVNIVKKNERVFFSFMDGHPLYDTHHVNCLPETEEYVPNFIGTLPCSD